MAHYVAKVLHIRPSEILDTWSAPELYVAFGEYSNEQSAQQYADWKSLDSEARQKVERPRKYAVYFHGTQESINIDEWQQN